MIVKNVNNSLMLFKNENLPKITELSEEIVELIIKEINNNPANKGKQLLVIDRDADEVFFIDSFKVITAIAGVIATTLGFGSVIAASIIGGIIAGTAFISSLGAFKRIRLLLPREQGIICNIFYTKQEKEIEKNNLKRTFAEFIEENPNLGLKVDDFEKAISELRNLGVIKEKKEIVIFKQKIIIRV